MSIVGRVNWNYFGWRDVYDLSTATLNPANSTVDVAHDRVWSTPEWGFTVGLRYYFVSSGKVETERKQKKDDPNVILSPKKRQ